MDTFIHWTSSNNTLMDATQHVRRRNDASDSGEEAELHTATRSTTGADVTPVKRWRYCLHIAYYGTGFVGWQRQNEKSSTGMGSVQELVEDAVTQILRADERVNVTSVSRTDAGTHALYQYGSIRLTSELSMPLSEFKDLINAKYAIATCGYTRLTENVVVHDVTVLNANVKPTRIRSRYKKYIYYIQQGHRPDLEQGRFSWYIGKKVYPERLREALSYLVGLHDFRPFSQGLNKAEFADKTTIRELLSAKVRIRRDVNFSLDPRLCGTGEIVEESEHLALPDASATLSSTSTTTTTTGVVESNEQKKRKVEKPTTPVHFICVELIANGFLRHMVRRIMGTIRPIGEGTFPPIRMKQVLDGELEPGPSAPTKGLWLHRTWLTQEDWDADASRDD